MSGPASGSLSVEIVTPRAVAWTGRALDVQAPGEVGEFGVLPGHIPLITTLRPGTVAVRTEEGLVRFVIGSGFAEAGPDRLVILTESCEEVQTVNSAAAAADLEAAELVLKSAVAGSAEYLSASRKAAMARARLSAK